MMTQNRQKLSRVILMTYILRATDGADFPNIDEKIMQSLYIFLCCLITEWMQMAWIFCQSSLT